MYNNPATLYLDCY